LPKLSQKDCVVFLWLTAYRLWSRCACR